MIVYSDKLLSSYAAKYVNKTNDMVSQDLSTNIDSTKCREFADLCHDVNYAIILSNLTDHEQLMIMRFYEVFLFRIYTVKKKFRSKTTVDWKSFQTFIKSNASYEKLFWTCFHYYF